MDSRDNTMETISLAENQQPTIQPDGTPIMNTAEWEKSTCISSVDRLSDSKGTPPPSNGIPHWGEKTSYPPPLTNSGEESSSASRKSQIVHGFYQDIWRLLATLGLFIAIIVILRTRNGKLEPNWRHINLSALIAVLATFLRASMVAVVSEAMSQLKWTWFSQPRNLRDLDYFDQASRGVWGSVRLITAYQKLHPVLLGAIITILSFGIGPFGQQAIKSVACQIPMEGINATIPIIHNYTNGEIFRDITEIGTFMISHGSKGALVSAFANPGGNTSRIIADCPSGNCTFPSFGGITHSSMGICSRCKDITSDITEGGGLPGPDYYYADGMVNVYNYSLPSNTTLYIAERGTGDWLSVNTSLATEPTFGAWEEPYNSSALTSTDVLAFTARTCRQTMNTTRGGQSMVALTCNHVRPELKTLKYDMDVIASQCVLYPCIKKYHASITAGILSEEVVSTVPARQSPEGHFEAVQIPCFIDDQQYDYSNFSQVSHLNHTFVAYNRTDVLGSEYKIPTECFYQMDMGYARGLTQFLRPAIRGSGHADRYSSRSAWGEANNITDNVVFKAAWWLPSLYNKGNSTLESVSSVFDSVGTAYTNYMRTSSVTNEGRFEFQNRGQVGEFVYGTNYRTGVCIKFDWKWLLFPAVLLFGTLILFLHTILITYMDPQRLPVWRSSLLPLLYYRLNASNEPGRHNTFENNPGSMAKGHVLEKDELQKFASKHVVTFTRTETGAGFKDVDTWRHEA